MDLKKFRTAVNKGKKVMADNSKKTQPLDVKFYLVDTTGKKNELSISVEIKKLSGKDFEDFHAMQYDYSDPDNPEKVCSRYTAATIVGCVDKDGKRVFSEDDIDFLEHEVNAPEAVRITGEIFAKSELNEDIRNAKKQN